MKKFPTAVALAVAALASTTAALAQSTPEFKFSGFGTVGAVHSDNDGADFVGTRFAPNGAGRTRSTSLNPDSKLGVQFDVRFGDRFSGVVQLVSQHQYDNSFTPEVEWANLKYKVSDNLSVRIGRIALPAYVLSESRFVGYSYVPVRPSVDVYTVLPVTSNDGVDFSLRNSFGAANNTFQGFYGVKDTKVPNNAKVKTNHSMGFRNTLELGSLSASVGYLDFDIDLDLPQLAPLFGGIAQFANGAAAVQAPGFQAAAASARAMLDKYKLDGMKMSAISLGAGYDPGDWYVAGEYVQFKGTGIVGDTKAWNLGAGYRLGAWTPFVAYGKSRGDYTPAAAIDTSGAPPLAAGAAALVGGLNASLQAFAFEQKTTTVGVRWDAVRNVAVKAQFDRVALGAGSAGRFVNATPGFAGSSVNLLSVAVDFVF